MIYYITGGARSGKSAYASDLALKLSDAPIYVATARRWDDDFGNRIARHQNDRDHRWTTVEQENEIASLDLDGKVAVIDCVTLWLTNYYVDLKSDVDLCLEKFKEEIDQLMEKDATYIIISNELGMGLHAESESSRKFVDLQGWANQYVASKADKVVFMISGIPQVLKE